MNEQHLLLTSDFIFLDTAHSGEFEWEVYCYLRANKYDGFIIYDDIHWSPAMEEFWSKIPNDKKYDLSEIGHGGGKGPNGNTSGTGLVYFESKVSIEQ